MTPAALLEAAHGVEVAAIAAVLEAMKTQVAMLEAELAARFADAKARKRYAGTAPITVASGKKIVVRARMASNRHLADACYWWAFCALSHSPGARAFYDARRAKGDGHDQALRVLANRLVGILHGCLRTHAPYDEATAWPAHTATELDPGRLGT